MTRRTSPSTAARRRASALAAALGCLAAATVAAPAASAATADQVRAAIDRGATYLGSPLPDVADAFGADWALTSLAAAGRDGGALRIGGSGPAAIDHYRGFWTGGPEAEHDWTTPSGQKPGAPEGTPVRPASDYAAATLIAHALGLEPTRLAPNQNLIAQLAGIYRGRPADGEDPDAGRIEGNFGAIGAFDGASSSLLALSRTAAPQVLLDTIADVLRSNQLDNGGWKWGRVTSAADRAAADQADVDMTGQVIAALCDAGVRPSDSAIVRGLDYLRSTQLANGSFAGEWTPDGNTNAAARVVIALNACGIDPQGPDFTSPEGQSPIDYLLAQQLTTGEDVGAFGFMTDDGAANYYATQEAVRALTGETFSATPARIVAAPKVADGTVVPQAVVIDAGIDATGERDLRVCRVSAPAGASVTSLLETAATTAQPAGCVTGLTLHEGTVRALNGVTGDREQRTWLVRIAGGPAQRAGGQPVCQGQIVSLYVGRAADAAPATAAPCSEAPKQDPTPQPPSPGQPDAPTIVLAPSPKPTVRVAGSGGTKQPVVRPDRRGRIRVTLRCPATAGKRDCWSTVNAHATYRSSPRSAAKNRRIGGRSIRVASGRQKTFTVALSSAFRRDLRRSGGRSIRIDVRTQGDDAAAPSRTSTRVTVRAAR